MHDFDEEQTTGFASLVRNNRASAATRNHDDDPNDGSTHSGPFDNFIIEPVPGLDDDPRSPIYIPEYEEEGWFIDYGDNDDLNDRSTHSGRFDDFIIEPVSGLDDDPRSPIYIPGEYEEVDRRIDWPRYYFPDSDSDTNLTYNNINRPIHGPEEIEEADERIDDDDYYPGGIFVRPGKYAPGTGQVIPEKFTSPNSSIRPQDLFPTGRRMDTSPPVRRFISRLNPNEMLIYTDGACLGNGQANPRAGCGVVFREPRPGRRGHLAVPLEWQGPNGHPRPQTSNRAELRAVVMALQFRYWPGEGWTKVVIATDSEYVVEGATSWIKGWLQNGWRTRNGRPVKNKDLWKCLLGRCEELAATREKTKVEFWRIPREWNAEADGWAKHAAAQDLRADVFLKLSGLLI